MRPDALSVLRQNREEIRRQERDCQALKDGILWEAASLCRAGNIAEVFRSISDEPLCCGEFASLCRTVYENRTEAGLLASLLPDESSEETPPDTRTAYLRSAYTDRAFSAFSRHIERLSAQYQSSFAAGCEEVYYGRCSYCILPIRNSEDGALTSFIRLITKYDLKIARICDVTTQDGDNTMRYALLRRGLELSVPDNGILQATLVLPNGISAGQFLSACELTGASVDSATTLPLRYTSEIASLCICFRIDKSCAAPLLCFLSRSLDSCTVDGIYSSCGE